MAHASPSFLEPPIREVVLGVQFDRADQGVVHLGRFSQQVAAMYPNVIEVSPIPRVIEPPEQGSATLPVHVVLGGQKPRLQMYDGTGNRFLQLQVDRFHANWQKLVDSDEYPRFDAVLEQFLDGWHAWKEYCGSEPPVPVQYEITYINHVLPSALWTPARGAELVFPWLAAPLLGDVPEVECALHYWVPECSGRLHVTVRTAKRLVDNARLLQLELTLRGGVAERGRDDDMSTWMDLAHERLDSAFMRLTSADAHKAWRLVK